MATTINIPVSNNLYSKLERSALIESKSIEDIITRMILDSDKLKEDN